jgi:uncharacterized membrane protein YedE/YeeE
MSIDWTNFTPWPAIAGGALIGCAVAMLILLNGRVAGISGILGGLLHGRRREWGWRVAFLGGLLAAPLAWQLFAALPEMRNDIGYGALIATGLLVGIGTRYASGCTSGHGVCGLSRLSPRSLAATLAFMGSGFVTVYLFKHAIGA